MNRRRIIAIAAKDMREVTASSSVTVPMAVVPIVLCMVVPSILLLVGLNAGAGALGNMEMLGRLADRYPVPADFTTILDRLLYVFLNYTFLPFFMITPIMASSIIAANSIVGEKERGTLETLLYTPVTNRELIVAKLLSAFVPAMVVTAGGFLGYYALSNGIYAAYRGVFIIRAVIWIPALLLLAPTVSLLGLSVSLLVSLKAKTFMEAQQMSGLVVVPFVALLYGQVGGLLVLGPLLVVLLGIAALGASYVIYGRIGPRFSREQILKSL